MKINYENMYILHFGRWACLKMSAGCTWPVGCAFPILAVGDNSSSIFLLGQVLIKGYIFLVYSLNEIVLEFLMQKSILESRGVV